jgi:tetratricopeptide (TPR) repeat protein
MDRAVLSTASDFYTMENSTQILSTEVIEIIKGINSGETVVFCGGGISRDSGLPIVNQLVPYILKKLEVSPEEAKLILDGDNNPRIPFEAFMQYLQRNSKLDRIFDIYNQGEPNTNHILFAKLIKAGKVKTIVTTNFDKLIERALSLEPIALRESKDYDVIYIEKDFENINWSDSRIRVIKIHGSVDNKEAMAITLKQVASQVLSKPRMAVIEQIFSKGNHTNVLVLGYSSSDVFDLSLQIQAIDEKHKKVYYVQHSDNPKVEDIQKQTDKNPFKKFKGSKRLYFDTSQLIKKIWESIFEKYEPNEPKTNETDWKKYVDEWYCQAIKEKTEAFRYFIPALIYLHIGEFKTAIEFLERALKIVQEIDDKQTKATLLSNFGVAYSRLGEHRKAIEYYNQALVIKQEIADKQSEGICLGDLGGCYLSLGDDRKAIENYEQALKIAKEIEDKEGQGTCLGNLGSAYEHQKKHREAIEYYKLALLIAREIGDRQREGLWLGNLGSAYEHQKKHRKAIKYYKLALLIAREIGDKQNEGLWLGNLGSAYEHQKKHRKAIKYYKLALLIAREIGDKQNEGIWRSNRFS